MSGDEIEAVVSAWRLAPVGQPACSVGTALEIVAGLMAQRVEARKDVQRLSREWRDERERHADLCRELGYRDREVKRLRAALVVANEWMQAEGENGDAVPDEFCTPAYQEEARRVVREALGE